MNRLRGFAANMRRVRNELNAVKDARDTAIREAFAEGWSGAQIARAANLNIARVHQIKDGDDWRRRKNKKAPDDAAD